MSRPDMFAGGQHTALSQATQRTDLGVVVIGRNEGARLQRCLDSVGSESVYVVYVDSGSSDGSVARARALDVNVVELDGSQPFSAARARNAGFRRLAEAQPDVRFVQFVDGDCELRPGWLELAGNVLEADAGIAVVCGRLRERHPERSIYNRICDMGWDYPIGDIAACGGVAMYRNDLYATARGFNERLIAGEEFELCQRLRRSGGRIVRLDAEMAWHDVGMTRFVQWWRRSVRVGFGFAEGAALHSGIEGSTYRRNVLRALLWGIGVPAALVSALGGAWTSGYWAAIGIGASALVLVQILRLWLRKARRGVSSLHAASFGFFLLLGKLPEAQGILRYWATRVVRRRARIIEYR